ncbi:type II toxin-antitoxin system HicA family toxin [Methanogenium cariaci]|uniref:type II toxin-antitoxin system HicA family toxin n=1 Tax=Methanogenium cariaci TaxID=2197 RepID=UPI001FE04D18|nr:type II toxin-antitoxin system HicA family toxin [Methanogenium cariaci]
MPGLNYDKLIVVLQRDGWVVVRQRGSHIRMQKHTQTETLKLTVPAHQSNDLPVTHPKAGSYDG